MPETIKSIMNGLSDGDRRRLLYAFENGLQAIVLLEQQRFIGVNVTETTQVIVDVREGYWAIGRTTVNKGAL